MNLKTRDAPAPLAVAASLAAVEGLMLLLYAVLVAASVDRDRLAMGITTSTFFAVFGAGLVLCAWALVQGRSWARSPVVLAQLLQLGVAWSFRGGETTLVAIALAWVAIITLVGILLPSSIEHLED